MRRRAGFLLWEMLILCVMIGVLCTLGAVRWQAWQTERRLTFAAYEVAETLRYAQRLAQDTSGGGVPEFSFGAVNLGGENYYYVSRNRASPARKHYLAEGISFAVPGNQLIAFRRDGRPGFSATGGYRIVLVAKNGARRAVIISAQTGRVRTE
ncbi:MAG: type II secretion system GspH family protein [Veillonellaceae bacterium]|nr:type II secretion system GspH family protein [Veillonellaceae bacterium]